MYSFIPDTLPSSGSALVGSKPLIRSALIYPIQQLASGVKRKEENTLAEKTLTNEAVGRSRQMIHFFNYCSHFSVGTPIACVLLLPETVAIFLLRYWL